ncbi:hypothetical protein MKW98_025447 [Papaver atlanticum]|uniref:Sterol 3-beta-glucosyltransferase n=1 Tax=Papaver atlanticum TaxID=357466 RepID=A0AAD4SBJ4_9MAGN|nr:hypothetical protein MKW98_025447 [Papaver atlanticum]
MLKRMGTVKHDGTVEFEVPMDVRHGGFDFETADAGSEAVDKEPLDSTDLQYIQQLQIVMLIVGTRGDVQPFIAIGKRLQYIGDKETDRQADRVNQLGQVKESCRTLLLEGIHNTIQQEKRKRRELENHIRKMTWSLT